MKIDEVAKMLRSGSVVALPTETVYGLAASIACPTAIEQIFSLKNRPADNPIIVHVGNQLQVKSLVSHYPPQVEALMERFWPGPLTLIFEADTAVVPRAVRAGMQTVGIRMPDHEQTLKIIKQAGPIVAPSANISGKPSATTAEHVRSDFGEDLPVFDGGRCTRGIESTILHYCSGEWEIVRQGAITQDDLLEVLGYRPQIARKQIAPGSKYKHYSPNAKLLLNPKDQGKTVLGFSDRNYPKKELISLGSLKDPAALAFNLYDRLREIDREGIPQVWVDMDFPDHGLYQTLRERLLRAAAKEHI